MTVGPFRVLEGEVRIWDGVFDLKDGQDISLSFIEVSPNWVEVGNGLQVTCKSRVDQDTVMLDHAISVHLEAWMDEPPGQREQWDETCDLLIDWTSGTIYLDTGVSCKLNVAHTHFDTVGEPRGSSNQS